MQCHFISCSTIKPKELLLEYCYHNMVIEVVLPQSAPSGLVLMLQGTTISLLPTPISGASKLHVQDHLDSNQFPKSLPEFTSTSSWLTELTVKNNILCWHKGDIHILLYETEGLPRPSTSLLPNPCYCACPASFLSSVKTIWRS